ncbi:NAD(P)/FAD-dependent oxidoreductase [Prosthecochloris ethylica]|nr:NAD(P)/FAD-dependent oxidoreductase [Prosthecochloris ethylica]
MSDLIIVGGGAAGMFAAVAARFRAREQGVTDRDFQILLIERNRRPGAKISISGGGKCNVTHDGDVRELMAKGFLRASEQRFLRHALYNFSNTDLRDLLCRCGVDTVVREDGHVFPSSGSADDIVRACLQLLNEAGVRVVTQRRVIGIVCRKSGFAVQTSSGTSVAPRLIIATGGVSYPHTGSTGDGLDFARACGHSIVPPSPALAPVFLEPAPRSELAGVSLRDVVLGVSGEGESHVFRGDLLFTHKGLSGPAVFSLSRDIADIMRRGSRPHVSIDLLPDCSVQELEAHMLRYASGGGGRYVRTFLREYRTVPAALIGRILRQAGIGTEEKWGNLGKKARRSLQEALKNYCPGRVQAVPLDAGEVSAGGVSLDEVNAKTMESRRCCRLFFCGEVLDYCGEVGGFNLQAAWSTGWLAGQSAGSSVSA